MSSVINTNVPSLNSQRNLAKSQDALQVSLQRLSSGLRINSAKDDAAGLAIASRFTSQINGLNQAARNANDGISLTQTAEGALAEVSNNLQRIRELALQSANSTNSASDRASLDAESQSLIAEITRVASQTQFNGLNLLDGSFTTQSFQVGANANQTIDVSSIADARATALGTNLLATDGSVIGKNGEGLTSAAAAAIAVNGVTAEAGLTINTVNGGTTSAFGWALSDDAKAIAASINTAASSVGVTATATNVGKISTVSAAGTISFTLNSSSISAVVTDKNDLTSLMGSINAVQGSTGITATFTSTTTKDSLTLTTSDGRDIKLASFLNSAGGTATFGGTVANTSLVSGGNNSSTKSGYVSLASSKGAITVAGGNTDVFSAASMTSSFSALNAVSLTSAASSQTAIATVDAALSQVNVSRGSLGAYQNRFMSAISSMQTTAENLSASRSRIQDADFASETANLTKAQILQQAGTAMLAQANSLPQSVLSLLK